MSLDRKESNLIEVAGFIARHPQIGARFSKDISFFAKRALKDLPGVQAIIELVIDHGRRSKEPMSLQYLIKRGLEENPTDHQVENLGQIILLMRNTRTKADDEQSALWRVQERMIETLGMLPDVSKDALMNMREKTAHAGRILASTTGREEPVLTPFRGLSNGKILTPEQLPSRPSGITVFDQKCLKGGLVEGSAMIIAGVTNTGKSYLAQHFLMEDAFLGGTPFICSTEDNFDLTYMRWLSFAMGTSRDKIESMSQDERVAQLLDKYKNQPAKLAGIERVRIWCPSTPQSVANIIEKIDTEEKENGVCISRFVVDYIQNIDESTEPGESRQQRLASASKALIRLGQDRKKNCIIVSQAKAEADEGATLFLGLSKSMAESFAIGHNAHYILTMNVTKAEDDRRLIEKDKRCRINLAFKKNKFGPKDAFYSIFNGEKGRWYFLESENEREQVWRNSN